MKQNDDQKEQFWQVFEYHLKYVSKRNIDLMLVREVVDYFGTSPIFTINFYKVA